MTETIGGKGSFGIVFHAIITLSSSIFERYNGNMESPFYSLGINLILAGQMFGNWELLQLKKYWNTNDTRSAINKQ